MKTLWAAVLIHFIISVAHGRAHDGGHVALTQAQALFVYSVILAAPFVGLAVAFWRPRAGGLIVAAAMAGSLVFGVVNHFIIISPDHVSQVADAWRPMFTTSAVLLIASEAWGIVAGLRYPTGLREAVS